MNRIAKTLVAAATLAALSSAHAAVGDMLIYEFNAPSVANATVGDLQATLKLTETIDGVDFLFTPNWGVTLGNNVKTLQFAYSGEAAAYTLLTGPELKNAPSFQTGSIDSGYTTTDLVVMEWDTAGADKFDDTVPSTSWSLNGSTLSLEDFTIFATATADKPSPGFGVMSMPSARPSNWVAMGETAPVPEPETYALMALGLVAVGLAKRRRQQA